MVCSWCHLASRENSRTLRDTNISPITDVDFHVAEYSDFSFDCTLLGPFDALFSIPSQLAELSVGTFAPLSPNQRFLCFAHYSICFCARQGVRRIFLMEIFACIDFFHRYKAHSAKIELTKQASGVSFAASSKRRLAKWSEGSSALVCPANRAKKVMSTA